MTWEEMRTEFSDQFLNTTGLLDEVNSNAKIKHGLETEKYGITLIEKTQPYTYGLYRLSVSPDTHLNNNKESCGLVGYYEK